MNSFLLIIPAYNEAENIGKVIEELLAFDLPIDILIVNDGSVDRTAEICAQYPVTVVSHPYNLGYGAALQSGYMYAYEKQYRFVLQFDADGQHHPGDLFRIIDELQTGEADIVIGSRYLAGGSSFHMGPVKRLGVQLFRWLIYSLTDTKISDPTSGLRGITEKVFRYYMKRDRFPADYPDADILIQMILRKYRIREIPANMRSREAGESMHAGLKPLLYLIKISLCILVVLLRHKLSKRVPIHE